MTLVACVGLSLGVVAPANPAEAKRVPVTAPGPAGAKRGTGSSAVALTFDDGPDPVNTPRLLDLLKKHNVKATFCVVGHRVRDNLDVVRRIHREGHTLCNHSWQHLENLRYLPYKKLLRDLRATNAQIRRAVPGLKVRYFRAPYGNFSKRLNKIAAAMGMTSLFWDVDDRCYLWPKYGRGTKMVNYMFSQVRRYTRNGSIILSHDMAKPFTVTAYRKIVPWLKARHRLVALPR